MSLKVQPISASPLVPDGQPAGQCPPRSAGDSLGPGLRMKGEATTPTFSKAKCLRTANPIPACCFVPGQRQVGVKTKSCARSHLPPSMSLPDIDHHLGISKARHRSIRAATQLFRQETVPPPFASQDGHAGHLAAITCGAQSRQLGQPRAIFVLEHYASRRVPENAQDDGGRHLAHRSPQDGLARTQGTWGPRVSCTMSKYDTI